MTIRFESTKQFEKDLNEFPSKERFRIIEKLNKYSLLLDSNASEFYKNTCQPMILKLGIDNESSLYAFRVGRDVRIIMTVDDDPIFDQIILTLLRVVRHSKLERAFRGMAESLYQQEINT